MCCLLNLKGIKNKETFIQPNYCLCFYGTKALGTARQWHTSISCNGLGLG